MPSTDHGTEEFVQELTSSQDELLYFIRALCGNPTLAADIRQEVNLILWRKREKFRPGSNFKAWAFKISKLEVKAHLRKMKRNLTLASDPELLELFAEEFPATLDQLPERRTALAECMKHLTEKDTELLRHHYWSHHGLENLARATDRSVGTLKARLFQLRQSLRHCINRRLDPGHD